MFTVNIFCFVLFILRFIEDERDKDDLPAHFARERRMLVGSYQSSMHFRNFVGLPLGSQEGIEPFVILQLMHYLRWQPIVIKLNVRTFANVVRLAEYAQESPASEKRRSSCRTKVPPIDSKLCATLRSLACFQPTIPCSNVGAIPPNIQLRQSVHLRTSLDVVGLATNSSKQHDAAVPQ